MYIAKLDIAPEDANAPEEFIALDESVDKAIQEAIDRGYIKRNFGRFWIVLGHIVIDKEG